ncbi:tyrosine-type recombinase/integrase [Robertkochia solimangrovi]|uniref:tyrosine-type recombinase/integrase n=1 Tax=Robertkochia solimangrovi TaxID=2213046 RepID=UPI0013A5B943|nr:tyrosine-type recombinase/integrase [Robertkochia solimangrovi]
MYLKRSKLGAKAYVFDVLLLPEAARILNKYQDKDPESEYVFPWSKNRTRYQTFRSSHNAKLKRIQKNSGLEILPTGGVLTTKVIRHSFATIAKFKHVEPDIIRELMGHERGDIDTAYKDRYPEGVRDSALKEICNLPNIK